MNNPYSAYIINEKKFSRDKKLSDILYHLLSYGILAASSHNTQPWQFRVGNTFIDVLPDFRRSLPYSDRSHRELYISLGAVLGNLLVAAYQYDLTPSVFYTPEEALENVAVRLVCSRKQTRHKLKELFPFITQRMTNRHPHLPQALSESTITQLLQYNDEKNIEVKIVTQSNLIKQVAQIVFEATMFAFADQEFKKELSHWVTSVYTNRYDGIALFDFGIPPLITLAAPWIVRHMPPRMQAKADAKLFEQARGLLVISAKYNDKTTWMKVGKVSQYIGLAATEKGLGIAPWAGIVEHPGSARKTKKLLGMQYMPLYFARIGYPTKPSHHSPRRGIDKVAINSIV